MAIIKHKDQRVAVFIDTQNLYHTAKNFYRKRVNFGNLLKEAVAGRKLVRAIAYVIRTDTEEEKYFFEALEKVGIEAKIKDIIIYPDGTKKADWDIGLAIDAVKIAPRVDAVVIASGDGDFVSLVEYLKNAHQTQVEIIAFGETVSEKLIETADDFINLSRNPRKFLI